MARVRLATDERRAQLLELGVELFSRHAYDALTTDAIATQGSISKGLLFHYFGNKRGYYLATIEHVAAKLLAHVVLDASQPPFEAVLDALDRFLDFVAEHTAIYRALLRGGLGADPHSQAIVERVRWTIVARVIGLLVPERAIAPDVLQDLEALGPVTTGELRIYGWVGATEALSVAWIDRAVPREKIRSLMIESFAPVLAAWPRDRAEITD